MILLGIETSCDDTSAAILKDGSIIASNVISSQVEYHKKYGGVVPEIASRKHMQNIVPVVREAFERAQTGLDDISGVAVTMGPGLVGSLLVGINFAKAFAYSRKLPIAGINHLEGHILSPFIEHTIPMPCISLVVSGGHTNLYFIKERGAYQLIGRTRDDAAGEAFDKVAKLLGLGYPGGAVIERLASRGDSRAVALPRPMLNTDTFDFSFSGLKTAVLYYVKGLNKPELTETEVNNLAASFQTAVIDILAEKTVRAATHFNVGAIAVAGGVAANSALRERLRQRAAEKNMQVFVPKPVLCTDNAAMIAFTGARYMEKGAAFPFSMNAVSRWAI